MCASSVIPLLEEHGFSVLSTPCDGSNIVLARLPKEFKPKKSLANKEFVLVSDTHMLQVLKRSKLNSHNRSSVTLIIL